MTNKTAIPFFLVTGFLGAGKTTLLKRFLAAHAAGRRVLVVQNEFAESGVDGRELRTVGVPFEIVEVQGGSVFCVCRLADFRRGLADMLDTKPPEAVILEATGLADPLSVVQMLEAPELRGRICLAHVWCVADAVTFVRMADTVRCVRHQARVADTVIINKVEKIMPPVLEAARARARALNPWADIHAVSFCDVALDQVFAAALAPPVALRRAAEHADVAPAGRPPIISLVLRATRPVRRAALDEFLREWTPQVIRMKGYIQCSDAPPVAVQAVSGDLQTAEMVVYDGQTELVMLGETLDPARARADFAALAN